MTWSLDRCTPTMWLHTVLFKPKTYKIWQPLSKMMQVQSTQVKKNILKRWLFQSSSHWTRFIPQDKIQIEWTTRYKELSAETEKIIAGNGVMLMESKPWTIYWFSQGQKKEHLNRMREIQFRETSTNTERIKYNNNRIKTGSSKNIELFKVKRRHSWI